MNPIQEVNTSYYYQHLLKLLTVPVAGSQPNAAHKWLPVTAVVTYDGSILLYEAFEGDDEDKDDDADAAHGDAGANATDAGAKKSTNSRPHSPRSPSPSSSSSRSRSSSSSNAVGTAAAKAAIQPGGVLEKQKWYASDALLRISLRSADIEPLLTLGLDAFLIKATVVLASRGSFTSSLPGAAPGKTSVALLADSSNTARKWLQLCSHPSADADMEPPALYAEGAQ